MNLQKEIESLRNENLTQKALIKAVYSKTKEN